MYCRFKPGMSGGALDKPIQPVDCLESATDFTWIQCVLILLVRKSVVADLGDTYVYRGAWI